MITTTRNLPALVAMAGGMTPNKLRRLKARRWKYPLSLERQYTTAIARYFTKVWKDYVQVAVGTMVPRGDAVDLNAGGSGPALGAIVTIAKGMDQFNKNELAAFQKIAIGTAFTEDEPWLPGVLDTWAKEQLTLISKASQDMRDAVARRVRDGVKDGLLAREVTENIARDLPRISYNRAKIIARDQTAKLNADLTQGRMGDAGLQTYIWDTAQDERVRGNPGGKYANALPSHWVMQGKICRWDNPAVCQDSNGEWVPRPPDAPTTHPGVAILCRCVAVPNWQELEGISGYDVPVATPAPVIPEPEPEPEVDPGILGKTAAEFVTNIRTRFDTAEKFSTPYLKAAWTRLQNLPPKVRGVLASRLDNLYQVATEGIKAYYSPLYNRVVVQGTLKKGTSLGSDLVHEVGHALDHAIGKKGGQFSKYASAVRLAEFGNRNLAEIVRDELVEPMLEAAKKDRPNVLRDMLSEASRLWKAQREKLGDDFLDMPTRFRFFKAGAWDVVDLLEKLKAGPDVWAAIEDGNIGHAVSQLLPRLDLKSNAKAAVKVDRRSIFVTSVNDDLLAADDLFVIRSSFSDMVEAATGNTGYFGTAGHGAKYWRDDIENAASTEAFAEILEMLASPSPGAARILINKYLPTARDFVFAVIEREAL